MRILIGCEFSGRVSRAFRARGHEVWSCDLLPTEGQDCTPWHLQCDLTTYLNDGWDMLIAFPPCTHLCVSGAGHWHRKAEEQKAAIEFVKRIWNAPIEKIAIENPVGILSTVLRKPDQIVHPWWFGDYARKRTCLWLKNLPLLIKTEPPKNVAKKFYSPLHDGPQKADRGQIRSRTFFCFAEAMAQQWG